jgi:uncharacterized protein YjbI with pentapeptide repeats
MTSSHPTRNFDNDDMGLPKPPPAVNDPASEQETPEHSGSGHSGSEQSPASEPPELTPQGWERLKHEFSELHHIHNPIERDYKLIQYARESEVPTERYYAMFEAHQRRSARGVRAMVNTLVQTASFLGRFTILAGLILFILEADARKNENHAQAWKVIRDAQAQTESSGRIQALETLTSGCRYGHRGDRLRQIPIIKSFVPDCVSLRGLAIETAHLPEIRLPSADLRDARMQDTGLWSADFRNAKLGNAQLQRAKLSEAQFQGASLTGAQLEKADLGGAFLDCSEPTLLNGCKAATLTDANLRNANLREVTFGDVDLSHVNLRQAIYDRKALGSFHEDNTTSRRRLERDAILIEDQVNLDGVNLSLLELRDASLRDSTMRNAILNGVNLRRAYLDRADLTSAKLNCHNPEGSPRCADLRNASLPQSQLENAEFIGADLSHANFQGADFTNANLEGANLFNTDLSNATGLTVEQVQQANLWRYATYSDDFRSQLDL